MKTVEIQTLIEREPFRPFSVRLSNGAPIHSTNAATWRTRKLSHTLIYFGETDFALIDIEHIVEIFETNDR